MRKPSGASREAQMRCFHGNCALEPAPHDAELRDLVYYFSWDLLMVFYSPSPFVLLKYTEQRIQSLVRLAGYRQLISSLVIFDRSLRVRSENSVDLTGIDSESTKRCLGRPDLVIAELEIVPA